MAHLDATRREQGLPPLAFGAALHLGEILWGNVGAADRLDFTAIGPAVNLVSRLEGLCRPLGRTVLISGAVAAETTAKLIPLGTHALRGIAAPCAVFTVTNESEAPITKKLNRSVDYSRRALILNHMVEHSAHLDAVFHALADPTRRAMLGHLAERELTIGELATPFSMSFAGASKHVRVLENAGPGDAHDPRPHPSVPPRSGAACGSQCVAQALRALLECKSSTRWNRCCSPKTRRKQRKKNEGEGVERWTQRQSPTPMAR